MTAHASSASAINRLWINDLQHGIIDVPASAELHAAFVFTHALACPPLIFKLNEGSSLTLHGLVALHGADCARAQIVIEHAGKGSVSHVHIRSLLYDSACAAVEPTARILKGAHGASATVALHALLLGDAAHNFAAPNLEIDEHDVIARHAASMKKASGEETFYLQSRGLSPTDAESLIAQGFVRAFIQELPCRAHAERLAELMRI